MDYTDVSNIQGGGQCGERIAKVMEPLALVIVSRLSTTYPRLPYLAVVQMAEYQGEAQDTTLKNSASFASVVQQPRQEILKHVGSHCLSIVTNQQEHAATLTVLIEGRSLMIRYVW